MKAIILAGGFGTRLRPVISNIPKVMAPVNNRPFLEYILDSLVAANVKEVFLSVYYLSEIIENHFGSQYKGMKLSYIKEPKPLGTGGALKYVLHTAHIQEPVLVLNGDSYVDCDLQELRSFHHKANADISMVVKKIDNNDRYGTVEIKDTRVIAFKEKSKAQNCYINAGVYVIEPDIFTELNLPECFSFEKDFLQRRVGVLDVGALPAEGFFVDIGMPEDYDIIQNAFNIKKLIRTT